MKDPKPVRLARLIGEAEGEVLRLVGRIGFLVGYRGRRRLVWFTEMGRAPFEFDKDELEDA